MIGTVGAEPWDTEWAAARSAEALRYLGRNYPECLENLRALDEYEEQAHRAAMRSVIAMDTLRPSETIAGPVETRPCGFGGGGMSGEVASCDAGRLIRPVEVAPSDRPQLRAA